MNNDNELKRLIDELNELLGENNEFYNNWNANLSWCTDR